MIFRPYYYFRTGCASYLFGCGGLGKCAMVDAHEEDAWIGTEVRIGEATILVNGDVGRCVVTSRDPDTGVIDLPTLATLASYRPNGATEPLPFGVYGSVLSRGRVRIEDTTDSRLLGPLKT